MLKSKELVTGTRVHPSIINVGVLQDSLEDSRVEVRGGVMDESLDSCIVVVAGRTVAKRNCLVSEKSPGRVRSRGTRDKIGRNTHNPEE